jgi:hypothetical protein
VFESKRIRVLFPGRFWTPIRKRVFEEVLAKLTQPLSQTLYLQLYDRVWHSPSKAVEATMSDLAEWTGADARTLKPYVELLCREKFLVCLERGRSKSRTRKPRWRVPLAEFSLSDTGNPWTPVPRFFITEYFRAFRPSVILTILQWYQHINWRNDCWVGIARLCQRTGWARRSVYEALHTLGKQKEWERISQNLPRPLEISQTPQQQTRHFRVLAVAYEQKKRRNQRSTVSLTPDFARHFGVRGLEKIDIDFRQETHDGDGDVEEDASADTDFDADADIDTDTDGNVDVD